jgi:hypothetical protein
MKCHSCDEDATQMFHFRRAGSTQKEAFTHIPTCDLHSLKDRPQCGECFCKEDWEVLMERERNKRAGRAADKP